jgi:hypothetical protein
MRQRDELGLSDRHNEIGAAAMDHGEVGFNARRSAQQVLNTWNAIQDNGEGSLILVRPNFWMFLPMLPGGET